MRILMLLMVLLGMTSCAIYRPVAATSHQVVEKKGEACYRNILGFIPLSSKETTIYRAATNGNIKNISTVDHEMFISLIYNSECVVVHGQ